MTSGFVGATNTHADAYLPVAQHACGLKIYVSDTFGSLRIDTLELMHRLFRTWAERAAQFGYRRGESRRHRPRRRPRRGVDAARLPEPEPPLRRAAPRGPREPAQRIELIRRAKDRGYSVTAEATPHHLFLSTDDLPRLGARGDMRPRLATPDDVAALWENMDVIDIFATDHAPHTLAEKALETPPPGVPGVETMLPLLLTAVARRVSP
ncbi:MAG: hypothetical protein R2851_07160 [Caldilineaceae bacterium]